MSTTSLSRLRWTVRRRLTTQTITVTLYWNSFERKPFWHLILMNGQQSDGYRVSPLVREDEVDKALDIAHAALAKHFGIESVQWSERTHANGKPVFTAEVTR